MGKMDSAVKRKHLITALLAGCRSTNALIHGTRVYEELSRLISPRFDTTLKEQCCHLGFSLPPETLTPPQGQHFLTHQPQGCLGQRQVPAAINPLDLCRRNCAGPCPEAPKAPTFLPLSSCHRRLCAGRSFVPFLPQNVAVVQPWCGSELLGLE